MIQFTWLGHASFELRVGDGEIYLIDPWLENPSAPANYEVSNLDGILLTHGHFDHMASVVDLANNFDCPVLGIYDLTSHLETQGVKHTIGMNKGGTGAFGSLQVTLTYASHSSPYGDPVGFILGLPDGRNLYHAGDTDVFGDMRLLAELYRPEIAVLPIGDFYTMGPKQAAMAVKLLRPKTVVPMHYGTFPALTGTPEALRELIVGLPETTVVAPAPGERIEI
jgi:L-ascorbate metabolism protein UlaG (beta-lactamase superfamily)